MIHGRMAGRWALALLIGLFTCTTALAWSDAARLAALKLRMVAMESEIANVEAITKIQRLGRAFGYYTDKGYFGEAADLFTVQGTFHWGSEPVAQGAASIRELLTRHGGGSLKEAPGLPFGRLNLRMQLQPVITIAADGRHANGRWREWGLLGQYRKEALWADALIEDAYVNEGGVWKVAARHYTLNFEAPYQGGWALLKPATATVPPFHYSSGKAQAITSRPSLRFPVRANDALGRLEARADEKETQLARTHSVRALENLQAMYGYYIDKGLWKEAAALFARSGSYEAGQSGVYVGNQSIERGLSLMGPAGLEPGQLNNYVMVQPIIHVSSDNRSAKARWRSDAMLARSGQGRWGGGVYENEYVNENGIWRFSKLHYYVTFWGDYVQGWQAQPLAMDPPSTIVPPDRPPTVVYESFPTLQVVPYHYPNPVSGKPHAGE